MSKYADKPPIEIYIRLPESAIERADFGRVLFQDRIPAWIYEPLFTPLQDNLDEVLKHGIEQQELMERDVHGNLSGWLARYGGAIEDYVFIPIHSRYGDAFIAMVADNGQFVSIVDIPPPL